MIVRIRKWLADLGKDQPSLKYLRRVAVIQVQHDYTEHVLLGLLSGHWYFLWVCCKLYVPHRSTVHLVSCCTCPKSICHFWNCHLYAIVVSFRMCVQLLFCTFFFFTWVSLCTCMQAKFSLLPNVSTVVYLKVKRNLFNLPVREK